MSWKGSWGAQPKPSWASQPAAGKGGSVTGSIKPVSGIKPVASPGSITKPVIGGKGAAAGAAKPAAGATPVNPAVLKAKVAKLTSEVESTEKQVNVALESAKKLLENEKATPAALKASVDSIEKHKTKLAEMQTSLTKERDDCRKAGAAGSAVLADVTKLLEKHKTLMAQVIAVVNKVKPKAVKAQQDIENKAKEAKDTASFKPILAKLTKDVATAEDAVSAVVKKAAPVVEKAPEGEELDKVITSIETAASEAMKKLTAAKADVIAKSKDFASYAPEAKKTANAAVADLQKKLGDGTKKAAIYQAFKKELPKLVASLEAVKEVKEKLEGHDKAITNATKLGDMSKLDKEKIDAIDNLAEPVRKAIKEASALIAQKARMADAATQATFSELKKKGEEMEKKLAAVFTKIKKQRDVIRSEEFVKIATEKFEKCEEGWTSCQEAEMPFLTGVEVLPGEQNDKALKACEEAITATSAAIKEAKGYVSGRLSELKSMEKDLADKLTPELTPFNAKIGAIDSSLSKFRKEHAERKVIGIMSGALDSVDALESKVNELEGKGLNTETVEDLSVEAIGEAITTAKAALAEATTKMAETKKIVTDKQKEAKAPPNEPASASIATRLNAANDKINKLRSSVSFGEKVVKAKKAAADGEEKVKEAESEVAKVKKFEGSTFSADSVKSFADACASALAVIKSASAIVQPLAGTAPPKAKATLQALLERKTEAQKVVDKLKADTKDAREDVLTELYLSEAEASAKAAEDAAEQMEAAEKPFVVGGDIPLAESLETIKKCEEAAAVVQKAVAAANNVIGEKSRAVKPFGEAAAKKAKEGFASKTERVKAVSTKLASFEKDLKDRTKSAKMGEAAAKVDATEALLQKTIAAAEPFTKVGGADISEADAEAPLKAFMELDKELTKSIATVKSFLTARVGEQKTSKENTETLKNLQERVSKAVADIAPAKKATKPHEQKALGKIMLAEATEQVNGLDAEIKKATDACAPLLESGGVEYLVDTSIKTLVTALQATMKEKELTVDKLFEEVAKGKAAKEKDFVAYLKALPEAISRDELNAFSDERRAEIFKRVGDGKSVKLEHFKGMFSQSYTCLKPVTLTDKFETEGSETVCKVEPGTAVTLLGAPKGDEAGLQRAEAQVGEQKGWISISQTKGATFLKPASRIGAFYDTLGKALGDASSAVAKASSSVATKSRPAATDETPLKDARAEIAKLKEKVKEKKKSIEELKRKVETAKRDLSTKEQAEKNAHIEARNLKEAAPFLEAPKGASPTPLTPGVVGGSPLLAANASATSSPSPCTVYVGRISAEVSDDFIKQLLEKCGTVTKWNRAADPNTSKLTSFGFCDFEAPQGVWRALEFLHEKQLCDKRLLVKCEEKAKETITQWKETKKQEFIKQQKEDAGKKDGEDKKDDGPLDDAKVQEKLLDESKEVAAAITKLLQEKSKGYPELSAEAEKEDNKEEEADKELAKKSEETSDNKENDKDASAENKKEEAKAADEKKTEERGKKRTRSEERRDREKEEKEKEKKAAVSRHYRPSRRERDREDRVRGRDRDIDKEYSYRLRQFERDEDRNIQTLKRNLRELDNMEPSEREKRKAIDADLHFSSEREEREWKRYREDRARKRAEEKEKDTSDRAQVQREADEERRRREKEEEEERIRKEKEAEEARLQKEREEEERRRKEAEEEARKKKEIEDEARRKKEAEEAERRRIEDEARAKQEAEDKKRQQAAAEKLLAAVQEEMKEVKLEEVQLKAPVVVGTVDGPRGKADSRDDDEKAAKHKPLVRAPDEEKQSPAPAAAAPAAAPASTGAPLSAAAEAKLRDDEMRRLIQQVPTEKARAFAFEIDWDIVHQNGIIEKKLRPWVRKKVTEYLGAEEQGMIEFIMRKVSGHTPPATILAELEGFIDEEAENFTLKMWRMLIFEVLRCKAR